MKKIKLLYTIATLSIISQAQAHDHRPHNNYDRDCIRENWALVKREVSTPSACEKGLDLKLTNGLFYYPLMNVGAINVRYWEGSFVKARTVKDTFKHEFANVCTGKVTYASEETREYTHNKVYNVKNPNLDRSIKESFRVFPMTDTEASTAYDYLKSECEADTTL